jgi:uncharacterized protein YjbI with pentapeptide repeats
MVKEYIKEHASNHANTLSFANCIISSTKNLLSITRGGYENINNFYGIIKCLDFTNTIFSLENSDSKLISGYETFGVDETDTIYNDFTELIQLNIERTNFCSTNLQSSTLSIYSANRTFAKSHFPKLKTLCLDATNIFTISNLTSSNFYSAIQTFSGCEFSMLEQLDLRDARFASSNLSTNNGNIATADGTFMNCSLSNIQILNLDNAIFCSPNMTKNGQISTAG